MTWPPYRPPLTTGQKALRAATLLVMLLGVVATGADWAPVAVVLLSTSAGLLVLSLVWERVTRRHYEAERRPFEEDADTLLRALFGDQPK
jgi:hypothetical protein